MSQSDGSERKALSYVYDAARLPVNRRTADQMRILGESDAIWEDCLILREEIEVD